MKVPPEVEKEFRRLHRTHRFSDGAIAHRLGWSRRKVQYWRKRWGLAHNGRCRLDGIDTLAQQRERCRRAYAARKGWGHLLPGFREMLDPPAPGVDLSQRQADVLTALAAGPATRRQLARRLGLARLPRCHGGRDVLASLLRLGLVAVTREETPDGHRARYALADGVRPHERGVEEDGIDRLCKRIQRERNKGHARVE